MTLLHALSILLLMFCAELDISFLEATMGPTPSSPSIDPAMVVPGLSGLPGAGGPGSGAGGRCGHIGHVRHHV